MLDGGLVAPLVDVPPDGTVSDCIRILKANSSRWLRRALPEFNGFAWQAGYSSFTVSESAAPKVAAYIRNQAKHHEARDFAEELAALLSRHGIEFDPHHYLD